MLCACSQLAVWRGVVYGCLFSDDECRVLVSGFTFRSVFAVCPYDLWITLCLSAIAVWRGVACGLLYYFLVCVLP
jgi:hypothetical protein